MGAAAVPVRGWKPLLRGCGVRQDAVVWRFEKESFIFPAASWVA
jgi:hypothetical protein